MSPKSRRQNHKANHRRAGYFRPLLERLEDRTLPSTIFGSVWNDLIADGVRDAAEPPIAAVTIVLRQGGIEVQQTQTNGSGAYSFANLAPGLFTLAALAPVGPSPTRDVQLGSSDITGIDFGLQIVPTIPTNIDVTSNEPSVQQMPSVAVNPNDADHVVMAYMDYGPGAQHGTGFAGIGVSVSLDGGATWQQSSVPLPAGFDQAAGQPIVQFDAQGGVHVSFMAAKFVGQDSDGSQLTPGVIYDTSTQLVSYLNKTVSRRAFGQHANNGVFVASSADGGLNWNQVSAVSSQRYDQPTTSAAAITAGAGRVVTPAVMPANLFANKTLIIDEGLPSMERVVVTSFTATTFTATFAKAHAAGFTINTPVVFDTQPDLAIDTYTHLPDGSVNPNHGNLYVTWTRFYPAGQFPGRPTTFGGSEVMIAVSSDGGQTWTTRFQTISGVLFSAIRDPLTGATGGSSATATEGTGTNTLPRVTVGPEGGVYVSQFAGGRFPIFYSINAGVTFRNPVPIGGPTTPMDPGYPFGLDSGQYTSNYPTGASTQSFFQTAPLFNNQFRVQSVRSITADPARPGTLYAVDAVPILNSAGITVDFGEITFSRSTDYGVTWQLMTNVGGATGNLGELPANLQFRYRGVLNDDNAGRFTGFDSTLQDEVVAGQALPQLSVDAQGNIAVIWYDTRRDAGNKLLDVYGTISTDGGLTFSANNRITSSNFNADAGVFTDARNSANFYLGDRIGLALAGGKVYAAWTDTGAGNQDIFFASYDMTPAPFNDRFESNDTPSTATDLGSVTVQRVVPRLTLSTGDHDWFRVQAGSTGHLVIAAGAAGAVGAVEIELWDSTGTNKLQDGTALVENGQVVGVQIDYEAAANETFLLHVLGDGVPTYSLALQSLTADLGTRVQAGVDGTIVLGGSDVYRLVAGVGGLLQIAMTSGGNVQGNLNLQVLSSDGQTILAQGVEPGTPGAGEIENLSVAVNEGQEVLVRVLGATTASLTRISVNNTPVTLGLGTPGPAVNFGTPAATVVGGVSARRVTLQGLGVNPLNVKVVQKNAAGAILGTQNILLTPGTPVVVTFVNTAGTYDLQAMDPVGSGSYHLDITNLDGFQSGLNNLFFPAGGSSSAVATGDVNGDGLPDLVLTSTQGGDHVNVLLGNADGTFQAPRQFTVGSGQAAISAREPVLADFTGDGILDVVVPNYFSADVSILVGRGDGSFAPQRRFDAVYKANSVTAGDFNGDGHLDLAVMDRTPGTATVALLAGRGDGTFVPPQRLSIPFVRGDASPVRAGDLNGDGLDDLAVFGANDGLFQVLLGQGNGTFAVGDVFATGEVLFDAQLVDLNGDSKLDVVLGGGNTGSLIVLMGNGDGTFQIPQQYATAPRIGNDNIGVIGLAVADVGSAAGGPADGRLDVVVTTRYRSGANAPGAYLLPGIAPDGSGKLFGAAVKLGVVKEAGKIAVNDFDGDGKLDLAITELGGVRILYASAPNIAPNTTPGTARNLGTVVHFLSQPLAIVPGFTDAYYTLTVPTEAAEGAGPQVLDFSALFQHAQGTGLNMEVLDASGAVLATGSRFRITAAQGSVLTVHVFGMPAGGGLAAGTGVYTLDITVLPQVVSIEAQSFFPGMNGELGGPATSLVITFQGDRLDQATAEDARNYVVTNLDTGEVIPVQAPGGTKAVFYNPGANVDVSTGRSIAKAVRQTVTLTFDRPLPLGSYSVRLSNLKSADYNASEASQLAAGFDGHKLVTVSGGAISESVTVTAPSLVTAPGERDLNGLTTGTSFMTQMANDLAAELDALLKQFGDDPSITDRMNELIRNRCFTAWDSSGRSVSFLVLWLDPVSFGLADPGSNRTTFDQQTNVAANGMNRTYVEVGGNVEVVVTAAISGLYTLNISDVQPTARGGALILDGANVQTLSLTAAMRGGQNTFQFQFPEAAATAATTTLQSVAQINGLPPAQALANLLANTSELANLLITPELATAVLVAIVAPGSSTSASGDGTDDAAAENAAAMEAAVTEWVERNVLRLVEGLMPQIPADEVVEAIVNFLMEQPVFRLFRSLLLRANVDADAEHEILANVIALEDEGDAWLPDAAAPMSLDVPEEAPRAHAPHASAKWRGILFTAMLAVGGAYVVARDEHEDEKPAREIR